MIKIEKYNESTKGKKMLASVLPWKETEQGFEIYAEELKTINNLKKKKLNNVAVKISVPEGYFITIPKIKSQYTKKRIFYSYTKNDNFETKDIQIRRDRSQELYISIEPHDVKFKNKNRLYKSFYITVINNRETIVQEYYIFVYLVYKNNGIINNPNFNFDVEIVCYKTKDIDVTYGVIDFSFFGYYIFLAFKLIYAICVNKTVNINYIFKDPSFFIITLAYISLVFTRTKYIGNTWINKSLIYIRYFFTNCIFKKKRILYKNYYSKRMALKDIRELCKDIKLSP